LKKIALSGGSTQSNDVLIYEEFVFMEGFDETNNILSWHMLRAGTLDDYKILKQIYKNNVDKLTEKVKAFVEEEINAHYSNVDVTEFKEDIKRYDQLIANGGTGEKLFGLIIK